MQHWWTLERISSISNQQLSTANNLIKLHVQQLWARTSPGQHFALHWTGEWVRERGPLAMRENYLLMLPQFDKLLAQAKTLPTSQSRFAINKVRKPKTFTSLSSCSVSCTSLPTPSDKGNRTDTIKVFLFRSFPRVEKAFEVSAASNSSFDSGKRGNLWICEKPRTRAAFVAWRVWKNSLITLNNEQGRPALSHV